MSITTAQAAGQAVAVKLITETEVLEQRLGGGVDRSTLFRWRKAGRFPAPVKFNGGRNLYVESEVTAAIERLVAERDRQAEAAATAKAER